MGINLGGPSPSSRVTGGRKAQKSGTDFEEDLDKGYHAEYFRRGIASLSRHHMPTVPGPPSGRPGSPPLRRVIGKAPYDFGGVLGPASPFPGRAIIIEAKHMSERAKSLAIAHGKAKGAKGKRQGIDPDTIYRLATLWRQFHAAVGVVWRNEDTIGVLTPAGILWAEGELLRPTLGTPLMRIDKDRFEWIERRSMDYLPTLLDSIAVLDRTLR